MLVKKERKKERKLKFVAKIMTSKTVKKIITIHILPNISRNKGKQTTKFYYFIE